MGNRQKEVTWKNVPCLLQFRLHIRSSTGPVHDTAISEPMSLWAIDFHSKDSWYLLYGREVYLTTNAKDTTKGKKMICIVRVHALREALNGPFFRQRISKRSNLLVQKRRSPNNLEMVAMSELFDEFMTQTSPKELNSHSYIGSAFEMWPYSKSIQLPN